MKIKISRHIIATILLAVTIITYSPFHVQASTQEEIVSEGSVEENITNHLVSSEDSSGSELVKTDVASIQESEEVEAPRETEESLLRMDGLMYALTFLIIILDIWAVIIYKMQTLIPHSDNNSGGMAQSPRKRN